MTLLGSIAVGLGSGGAIEGGSNPVLGMSLALVGLRVPGIVVCERFGVVPEIFIAGDELSPAVFMNDEHRIKVRHFVAVLVQDFRPLHKSNVA